MKTRMHEILGVEPFEKFQVVGGYEGRNYFLDGYGWMRWGDSDWESDVEDVYNAVNNGIIRKPRFTPEQVEVLKALKVLSIKAIYRDEQGMKAITQNGYHFCITHLVNPLIPLFTEGCVEKRYSLEEHLNILQTLRDNGVEVENA